MCQCRPYVRTPFCGRPGCKWPEQVDEIRPAISPEAHATAQLMAEEHEKVAREHAAEVGFDIEKEPHGLFRACMMVLSSPELMKTVIERVKARRGG